MLVSNNTTTSSQKEQQTVNLITPDGNRIVWGFMFENTLFTEFERRNHPIIEAAYRQRKKKHCSHHITIVDSNLPKPGKAKVYFGVAQNHLRMPGTRYYVNRQVVKSALPLSLPMLMPSPTSTFSSSSFSSLDTASLVNNQQQQQHQQQQQQLTPQQQQKKGRQQKRSNKGSGNNAATTTSANDTVKPILTSNLPLVDMTYSSYSPITPTSNEFYPSPASYNIYNCGINKGCGNKNNKAPITTTTDFLANDNITLSYPSSTTNFYYDTSIMNNSISAHLPTTASKTTTATSSTIKTTTFILDFNPNTMLEDPNWFDILCLSPSSTILPQQQQQSFSFQQQPEMIPWAPSSPNTATGFNNLANNLCNNDPYSAYYYNNMM